MKKVVLVFFLGASLSNNAQSFLNENFDNYNVGNVSNDLTGNTSGQGNWFVYTLISGSANNFQFVNDINKGNVLSLKSTNATASQPNNWTSFVWKPYPLNAWANRNLGNDILCVEYEFFTGPTISSKSVHRNFTFTSTREIIAGLSYDIETRKLTGVIYKNLASLKLGPNNSDLILPVNQWINVAYFINYSNATVTFKIPSLNVNVTKSASFQSLIPYQSDFITFGFNSNTPTSIVKYNNFKVDALNNESLDSKVFVNNKLLMYPNPTNTDLYIDTKNIDFISNIKIVDLNGKLLKDINREFNDNSIIHIDLSDLFKGIYILKLYTNEGIVSEKIIIN